MDLVLGQKLVDGRVLDVDVLADVEAKHEECLSLAVVIDDLHAVEALIAWVSSNAEGLTGGVFEP